MQVEIKKTTESILTMQRNILFFLSCFLLVTTVASTGIAFRNKSITFFKAPDFAIELYSAKEQAEFLTHLILQRSLNTMGQQNQTLKPWVAPSYAFALNDHLKKQQLEMQKNGTDFEWSLEESTIEQLAEDTVRAYLKGTLAAYLPLQDGKKQLVQEEPATFVMDLKKSNGKLLLNNFTKDSNQK